MARSITNKEIGLIKAMLARGKRNVDIQFFFNRPDRPANSGRISQIRNNTYGSEVPQASEEQLDEFLQNNDQNKLTQPQTITQRAKACFEQREENHWHLLNGETSTQECKQDFDLTRINTIIRTIAGLANNKGGFIFFGVEDTEYRVVGLSDDAFIQTDVAQITDKVKTFLTPTPDFIKMIINFDNLNVGVISVEKYTQPPVIVCRDGDVLQDGSILFRYSGQSAKIKFGDLLTLLKERDHTSQNDLLKTATRISNIGVENTLIVDTRAGTIDASDAQITIDPELAQQLEFIREGEFEEVEGAPTLKLIGDVRAVDSEGTVRERIEGRALTADIVLSAFLQRERIRSPMEYIRESALVQRQWLPIFYFASLTNLQIEDVITKFSKTKPVYQNSKTKTLERLKGERSAFTPATGKTIPILTRILEGDFDLLGEGHDISLLARAVQALPNDFRSYEPVFGLLENIFEMAANNSNQKGIIFRASSRLDELIYSPHRR